MTEEQRQQEDDLAEILKEALKPRRGYLNENGTWIGPGDGA